MLRMNQNNFGGGELSPYLDGRTDLAIYYKGCREATNFIVSKEGTLRKRHGFTFKSQMKAAIGQYKLIGYKYDRTNGGFIVLRQNGTSVAGDLYNKDCTFISTTNLFTQTLSAAKFKSIQYKQIGDKIYCTGDDLFFVISVNWEDSPKTIKYEKWQQTSKPAAVKTITAQGYNSSDQAYSGSGRNIRYCAYIMKGGRLSEQKIVSFKWMKDWQSGYYVNVNVTHGLATEEAINEIDYVVIGKMSGGTYGELTRWYPEEIEVGVNLVFKDENHAGGQAIYQQTNVLGYDFRYPKCVDCFQQRLVFASAQSQASAKSAWVEYKMTLWFSAVGNLYNFFANRPADDSDSFSPTINSTGPSFIRWIIPYQEMMIVMTESGLYSVGFSQQQGFCASSCRISRFSELSCSETIQPVVTDAGIVFVGADNKTVYTAQFDINENMMKPVNRSVLTEHLTRTATITSLALQLYPDNVIFITLSDGKYASFTFERNEEVYAWSHGEVSGCKIKNVISIGSVTDSSSDKTYTDLVYCIEKDEVEYLCKRNSGYSDEFIDGSKSNVKATLVTLRPESKDSTIAGFVKNVKDIIVRLYNTGAIAVINKAGDTVLDLVSAKLPSELFSGDIRIMPRGLLDANAQLKLVSDNAHPCEILQIVTLLEVN